MMMKGLKVYFTIYYKAKSVHRYRRKEWGTPNRQPTAASTARYLSERVSHPFAPPCLWFTFINKENHASQIKTLLYTGQQTGDRNPVIGQDDNQLLTRGRQLRVYKSHAGFAVLCIHSSPCQPMYFSTCSHLLKCRTNQQANLFPPYAYQAHRGCLEGSQNLGVWVTTFQSQKKKISVSVCSEENRREKAM